MKSLIRSRALVMSSDFRAYYAELRNLVRRMGQRDIPNEHKYRPYRIKVIL